MSDAGTVSAERIDHVLHIEVDRSAKMNGFTPELFDLLSDQLTLLDESPDLWVGVLSFAGPHTTAGLDLPRFAGSMRSGERDQSEDSRVDAFGLKRRCRKPLVMAVRNETLRLAERSSARAGRDVHDWYRDDACGRHCDRSGQLPVCTAGTKAWTGGIWRRSRALRATRRLGQRHVSPAASR